MEVFNITQFRCAMLRSRVLTRIDDLLPAYAQIICEICPCEKNKFDELFNQRLLPYLQRAEEKTLNNHRTEMGSLFGMFFLEGDIVYATNRVKKLYEDNDQPAFFKDICFKFQFPNGIDKPQTVDEKIENSIKIKPLSFLLAVLKEAKENKFTLTLNEVAFFIFNCLETLQGELSASDVFKLVAKARKSGIVVKVEEEGKAGSYSMQHIREQVKLLELANLVRIESGEIYLNSREANAIDLFISSLDSPLGFDSYSFSFKTREGRKEYYSAWHKYYSESDLKLLESFNTSISSLQFDPKESPEEGFSHVAREDMVELGDEGELFVYNYEKDRVSKYDKRLTNKVLMLGKTKGIGYDIQSIEALDGNDHDEAEQARLIEVKSTKRFSLPDLNSDEWTDNFTITRNEWTAAKQYNSAYYIYRVYFTAQKTLLVIIKDPIEQSERKTMKIVPTSYRADISKKSITNVS